uniref:Protein misato homolog 1 n=1 Tax=Sphenodon punctatus TaxID=8508 RepID=A0A8D0HKW2_SPHPU
MAAGAAVTLQLGHYAGCVGAHWWGLQEAAFCYSPEAGPQEREISHDALFRAGQTLQGQETYTPRLVLMDLKGSLNSLKREGTLYADTGTDLPAAWRGDLTTHTESPFPRNRFLRELDRLEGGMASNGDYNGHALPVGKAPASPLPGQQDTFQKMYQLEDTVQVWSDYLRVHLHPRSVFMINRYNHDGESSRLEAFAQGESLLQEPAYLEEMEDRLHFYVEECDYLQGFQVLCDLHNGFSGIGARVKELLSDEYAGKGILTWGLTPVIPSSRDSQKDFYRLMNTVLGIVHLSSHSSLFCPLSLNGSLGLRPGSPISLPHVQYDPSLNYHTSALLATALDTLSTPYRLHSSKFSMGHLADSLSVLGRKVVTAAAALPFPLVCDHTLPDALCSSVPWKPLSSCGEQTDGSSCAQAVVLRGLGKEYHTSPCPAGTEPRSVLHACATGEEVLARYLQTRCPGTFSTSLLLQGPCQVWAPYPQFFSPLLNKQGFLLDKPPSVPAAVNSIPVLTALQSSSVLHGVFSQFYKQLRNVDLRRWASYFSAGIELDDFQEALQELRTLAQCYKTSSEVDESDSD